MGEYETDRLPDKKRGIVLSDVLQGLRETILSKSTRKERFEYDAKTPPNYGSKPKKNTENLLRQKRVLLVGFDHGGDLEKAIVEQIPNAVISYAKTTSEAKNQLEQNIYDFLITPEGEKYYDKDLSLTRLKTNNIDGKRVVLMAEKLGGRPQVFMYQPLDKNKEKILSAIAVNTTKDLQMHLREYCGREY